MIFMFAVFAVADGNSEWLFGCIGFVDKVSGRWEEVERECGLLLPLSLWEPVGA